MSPGNFAQAQHTSAWSASLAALWIGWSANRRLDPSGVLRSHRFCRQQREALSASHLSQAKPFDCDRVAEPFRTSDPCATRPRWQSLAKDGLVGLSLLLW